ncbi:uncharacterized protein VTP21DRAFT_4519 [Calcarisporiella thermophila]|uniref:uncharacterized protein n=1 Tax=Calcarisporiella thermophila TaxID=911321 RepID=UPI0037428375
MLYMLGFLYDALSQDVLRTSQNGCYLFLFFPISRAIFRNPAVASQRLRVDASLRQVHPRLLHGLSRSHLSLYNPQCALQREFKSPPPLQIRHQIRHQIRSFHIRNQLAQERETAWRKYHAEHRFGKFPKRDLATRLYYHQLRSRHPWSQGPFYFWHGTRVSRVFKTAFLLGIPVGLALGGTKVALTVVIGGVIYALTAPVILAVTGLVATTMAILVAAGLGVVCVVGIPAAEMNYRINQLVEHGYHPEQWSIVAAPQDFPSAVEKWIANKSIQHEVGFKHMLDSRSDSQGKGLDILRDKLIKIYEMVESELSKRENAGEQYPETVFLRSNQAWLVNTVVPVHRRLLREKNSRLDLGPDASLSQSTAQQSS